MIFDVQAQDMRLHKGGAAVPCERIEAVRSHLIENIKCNLKFYSTSIAVHIWTILQSSCVYISIDYKDTQYWGANTLEDLIAYLDSVEIL